jgi:hypothetical protein
MMLSASGGKESKGKMTSDDTLSVCNGRFMAQASVHGPAISAHKRDKDTIFNILSPIDII